MPHITRHFFTVTRSLTTVMRAAAVVLWFAGYPVMSTLAAESEPCWVFFTDRGEISIEQSVAAKIADPGEPKRHSRRASIMPPEALFDERDLAVNPAYIAAVEAAGGHIRVASRYFNAVSADLDDATAAQVRKLPFVRGIRSVARIQGPLEPQQESILRPTAPSEGGQSLAYGASLTQVSMVGAVKLHQLGYFGEGVTIAVLDSGFDGLGHAAFDSVTISHRRDFVDNDSNPSGDGHGTQVLSILAGLESGSLVGVAPKATYLIGRTEIRAQELRIEEDYWVAGMEWADSLGADIISSSLGYSDFDDGFTYTYEDMDGLTAITTLAADIAWSRGIVVVTSAGNEGDKAWKYITAPADAFHIFSVGNVDNAGVIVNSSSRGPTADGRIKPEVVALGKDVVVVDYTAEEGYTRGLGTSFAAPAVSGAVALVLEANPTWGPSQVETAIRTTASRATNPDMADYAYGYGQVNAFSASGVEDIEPEVTAFRALSPYPQPVQFSSTDDRVYFPVDIPEGSGSLRIMIYTFSGELVRRIEGPLIGSGQLHDRDEAASWDGTNAAGDVVAPGVYYYTIRVFGKDTFTGKIAVIR